MSGIKSEYPGSYLELDFWLPRLKLAFEYQDPHHYVNWWYMNTPVSATKQRDVKLMKERGHTLIQIPCWWENDDESLIATIKKHRPDLLINHQVSSDPISDDPPPFYFKNEVEIPGVGQLMLASFVSSKLFNPSSWWVSEKYDGTRVCWVPKVKKLISRYAAVVSLPNCYYNHFPPIFMDCELWFGRGTFRESQQIYSNNNNNNNSNNNNNMYNTNNNNNNINNNNNYNKQLNWGMLRSLAFEFPSKETQNIPFEDRITSFLSFLTFDHPFIAPIVQMKCEGKEHVNKYFKKIIDDNGEGIMLKEPKSLYVNGRTPSFLKMKTSRDQEALVVECISNSDCTLQLKDNVKFNASLSSEWDDNHSLPQIGDIVSFSYFQFKKNGPVHARILRVRNDVITSPPSSPTSPSNNNNTSEEKRPHGYWTMNEGSNIRTFLDYFAKENQMDPLLAETWYNIHYKDIMEAGGHSFARHYSSYYKTLVAAYPTIEFDPSRFKVKQSGYWNVQANHKKYFDDLAKEHNFDPLIPSNWYHFNNEFFLKQKAARLLAAYNSSFKNALLTLYPDIGLKIDQFQNAPKNFWGKKENRRKFFDDFAGKEGFNPLIPENWYRRGIAQDALRKKGGPGVLLKYNNSISKALLDVYPTIGLDERRLCNI